MAEWLLLQLPRSGESSWTWMTVDAAGNPLEAPQGGAIEAAAAQATGRRTALLVASGDVLLTEVELPAKSSVRPQQLVAYALEEQLAGDIETLQFSVGPRDGATGRTPVAVVARALLSGWIADAGAHGISLSTVCAAASLLPDNPGHTLIVLDADTLSVRRAGHLPVALPADDIGAALEAALGEELATSDAIFYVTPRDWQVRSAEVEALRERCASLKIQLLNGGILPLLAPQLAGGAGINLLSGEFAPQTTGGESWRRWRLAAILAASLFAVHVGGLALQLLQQSRSENALDQEISAIGRRALPLDHGTGPVRARIEQRLLAAQGEAGGSGFMPALSALSQALGNARGATVQAISYRDGGLDLKVKASDAESLERIDQALRSSGWQAELTSGGAASSGYEGRIQMRRGGAPRNR